MKLSVSKIKLFKACRKAYEFKYVYNLEPVQKADALVIGSNYHKKLEQLYKTGDFDCDFSKESAMAMAYKKYIYPKFSVDEVEGWLSFPLSDGNDMIGRFDGLSTDGKLVEHKTTSLSPMEYEFNLQWDEQILAYMLMSGTREVYYTICVKPTIRQKKTESDEEFFERMIAWYDEDTDEKIKLIEISRTDEEITKYAEELEAMSFEMNRTEKLGEYYRNTSHCKCWGRDCEYRSICLNYNPDEEYIEFERRKEIADCES